MCNAPSIGGFSVVPMKLNLKSEGWHVGILIAKAVGFGHESMSHETSSKPEKL